MLHLILGLLGLAIVANAAPPGKVQANADVHLQGGPSDLQKSPSSSAESSLSVSATQKNTPTESATSSTDCKAVTAGSGSHQFTDSHGHVWNVTCKHDFPGGNLGVVTAPNFLACFEPCAQNPNCVGFSWLRDDGPGNCYLKSSQAGMISTSVADVAVMVEKGLASSQSSGAADSASTGAAAELPCKQTPKKVGPYVNTCGADRLGGDLFSTPSKSFFGCYARCNSHPECLGFTYVGGDGPGICYLKSTLAAQTDNSGVDVAVKPHPRGDVSTSSSSTSVLATSLDPTGGVSSSSSTSVGSSPSPSITSSISHGSPSSTAVSTTTSSTFSEPLSIGLDAPITITIPTSGGIPPTPSKAVSNPEASTIATPQSTYLPNDIPDQLQEVRQNLWFLGDSMRSETLGKAMKEISDDINGQSRIAGQPVGPGSIGNMRTEEVLNAIDSARQRMLGVYRAVRNHPVDNDAAPMVLSWTDQLGQVRTRIEMFMNNPEQEVPDRPSDDPPDSDSTENCAYLQQEQSFVLVTERIQGSRKHDSLYVKQPEEDSDATTPVKLTHSFSGAAHFVQDPKVHLLKIYHDLQHCDWSGMSLLPNSSLKDRSGDSIGGAVYFTPYASEGNLAIQHRGTSDIVESAGHFQGSSQIRGEWYVCDMQVKWIKKDHRHDSNLFHWLDGLFGGHKFGWNRDDCSIVRLKKVDTAASSR